MQLYGSFPKKWGFQRHVRQPYGVNHAVLVLSISVISYSRHFKRNDEPTVDTAFRNLVAKTIYKQKRLVTDDSIQRNLVPIWYILAENVFKGFVYGYKSLTSVFVLFREMQWQSKSTSMFLIESASPIRIPVLYRVRTIAGIAIRQEEGTFSLSRNESHALNSLEISSCV